MKALIPLLALVLCTATASAQSTATTLSDAQLQTCLLGTNDDVWARLNLTPDQVRRVLIVQEACKEECAAAGRKKADDGISTTDGSTIIPELDSILSDEQYAAWLAYCAGRPAGEPVPK